MRSVDGSILVSGQRWSSRYSICSRAAISSGEGSELSGSLTPAPPNGR
ncbi:Uncharacterised protein [Mycobacteroides abscessus subsp. abscessus]|nr:Uncharacterised protein [Mycobacteroides abscessus subsp. abscessus]